MPAPEPEPIQISLLQRATEGATGRETEALKTASDGGIAHTETGSGEPVVLIHCSSASGAEWHALLALLSGEFHCVVPDQWNCGSSGVWPCRSDFGLAQEAAPIIEIIHRIGAPVHLVGHSYGGGVALHIARERPDLVRSLVLIEPSSFHLLKDGGAYDRVLYREIREVADAVRRAVVVGDLWAGMAGFVDYWNGAGAWSALDLRTRMNLCQRLDKVVLDFQALCEEAGGLNAYGGFRFPTTLLCGDRSPAPSRRIVEMLAAVMRNARVVRIAGAGHMSPLTHPQAVNRAIRYHLRSAAPPASQARAA